MNNPYLEQEKKHFLYTFKRQPLMIVKAKGSFVWDAKGKKYLDFFSGLAVCGVGHNNAQVQKGIHAQTNKLLHSSNYFYTRPQMDLAKELTSRYPKSRVFFCNSGAEANELAVKLARLWATQYKKPGRNIITFQNAFHGRTLTMAAASQGANRTNAIYEPLDKTFTSVPYNHLKQTEAAITKDTIAIWLEPIQGEGGIHIAEPAFFKGIANLCRKHDLLLIVDEIQSGMGRTGTFFAFEQYGVKPDIISVAKGLAGGLPLGATLAAPRVADLVQPGMHGSTFGGNPVACAAALEVLKLLTPKNLKRIRQTSQDIRKMLLSFEKYPAVKSIRLKGLMVGMELNGPGDDYVSLAREKGLLINCTQGNVLRFLPPYFISKKEMSQCFSILHVVFKALGPNNGVGPSRA